MRMPQHFVAHAGETMKFLLKWQLRDRDSQNGSTPTEITPIDEITDTGSSVKLVDHWYESHRGVAILEAGCACNIHEQTLAWHSSLEMDLHALSDEG